MKKNHLLTASITISIFFSLTSCSKNGDKNFIPPTQSKTSTEEMVAEKGANPDEETIKQNLQSLNTGLREGDSEHYLYTESNAAANNEILVYKIKRDGSLYFAGSTMSGCSGTGKPLGSQGAMELDKNKKWLFAVNAGSNSVSSFKVLDDGSLTLAHTKGSKGKTPVSLSVHDNMLYVLNRGSDNIHGFWIGAGGTLTDIEGSTQSLSGTAVDAPQISFMPDGEWIAVTEKATNIISTFKVKQDGSISKGIFTPSISKTPFGFEFSRNRFMIVSNAVGGGAAAGSATSYLTGNNGVPENINGAVPNFESAPCWVAVTKYGRFAYITNTASNNISTYYVNNQGALYLVQKEAAKTDGGPLDIVVTENNYFVYELNSKSNTIGGYHRKLMGKLEFISSAANLPAPATGLATY